ncbi:MAG: hypothetical protein FWD02_04130 [Bacteroidales bacterium]|nr:hypothetical protein [Bacteroidales bacterium]
MKKIMITTVLVAFTVMAQAQFAVGGQLGFGTSGTSMKPDDGDDFRTSRSISFSIAPMVAYNIGDGLILGIQPRFSHGTQTSFFPGIDDIRVTTTGFGLNAFALYTYMSIGRVNFLAKPLVGFSTSNQRRRPGSGDADYDLLNRTNIFRFGVVPVVDFHVNERIMLIATLNFLEFSFTRTGTRTLANPDRRTVTNSFGFDFDGMNVVNLGALTIGFLYKL